MKVRDICAAMEEFAPPGLAYESDRVGLSIGDPNWDVASVLVALTVTPRAAAAAVRAKAAMIVSHHPLIWKPLHALRCDDAHTRMCIELAQARVACFAAHTNLDVARGGVNDTLAGLLKLESCKPLFPAAHAAMLKLVTFVPESHLAAVRNAVCEAGAGVIGEYAYCSFSSEGIGTFFPSGAANPFSGEPRRLNEEPERRFEVIVPKVKASDVVLALKSAHPYEEVAYDLLLMDNKDPGIGLGVRGELAKTMSLGALCDHVRKALGIDAVRYLGSLKRRVRTVAVLGGSGGGEVAGIPPDVDVYVTGEVGYHNALTAQERGLSVIEAGHDATEKCIVPVIAQFLKSRFRSLRISTHGEAEVLRTDCGNGR